MYSVVVITSLTKDDLGDFLKLPALETSKRVAQPQLAVYTITNPTANICFKMWDIYLTIMLNKQKYFYIKKSWY